MALKSAKDLALLAGRKLLLADDSITIQKVVDLTFADEGVKVISFGNGREAVERLEEIAPDIVLADVFMPEMSGYEVCEYIKQNDKLKHIPVVLLVGSFEPFDEAEARRVGADEILTKPFQSIRRLIDRVGGLMSGERVEDSPTVELPKPEIPVAEPALSERELAFTTADTQQFPSINREEVSSPSIRPNEEAADFGQMETSQTTAAALEAAPARETVDELLDLGDIGVIDDPSAEDFELDLDFDEIEESAHVSVAAPAGRVFVEPRVSESEHGSGYGVLNSAISVDTLEIETEDEVEKDEPFSDQMATTQEFPRPGEPVEVKDTQLERITDDVEIAPNAPVATAARTSVAASGQITLDQLAPEVIDAIARRAVEMLSENVVREIAWEVVPELSELLIKRQLEENKP